MTPAPLPPSQKKKKSKPNPALGASKRRSCVSLGTRWGCLITPEAAQVNSTSYLHCLSLSFLWRGGQGVPAPRLHIQVALNQEDKHRSVRLPLTGSGSLKPPQSEWWVEKLRTGAQGHVSGRMGRAPP